MGKEKLITLFHPIWKSKLDDKDAKALGHYKKVVSRTGGGEGPQEPPIYDPDTESMCDLSESQELFSKVLEWSLLLGTW